MIVRDSSRTLPAALQSVRPHVDEMVVVDTGSVDKTPAIATQLGARVFHFPWCDDFSAARNESLRHARGDWLFWMDSDDTIDPINGQKLRDLANRDHDPKLLGFVMQVHCPGPGEDNREDVTVVDHVKLIRNRPDLRFDGRIHEQILPAIRRAGGEVAWTDIFVVHSGFDHSPLAQERKRARDLRLLHMELKERPDHPFTLFNLGMTYTDMERFDEAAEYLVRSIRASEPGESHLRKAYALLVYDYRMLGRSADAWQLCETGLKLFPDDPELRFRSGVLLHEMGRHEEAVDAYRKAMRGDSSRQFASYDVGIKGFKARHNLAITLSEMGNLPEAEIQWREIVREKPAYRTGWRGLAENLVKQRKYVTATVLAENLDSDERLAPEAPLLRAQIHEAQNNPTDACLELERALESNPDDHEVLSGLCRLFFLHRDPAEAESYLKRLLAVNPEDAATFHNLGTVYLRIGRNHDAAECFGRSIKLRPDSADTWVQLGHAVAALGNEDDAIASWEHALEIVPRHPAATAALAQFKGSAASPA